MLYQLSYSPRTRTDSTTSGRKRSAHPVHCEPAGRLTFSHQEAHPAAIVKPPPIQYADSPEGKIAYQVLGDGPMDLLFVPQIGGYNLEIQWEHPPIERYLRRLASFSRLIVLNLRGIGLSAPVSPTAPPSAEEWSTDIRWVLDAAGSERAAILGIDMPASGMLFFPATYPERTHSVVLVNTAAKLRRAEDYPWGIPSESANRGRDVFVAAWGTGAALSWYAPEISSDERFHAWFARLERLTADPTRSRPRSARRWTRTCEASWVRSGFPPW